MKRVLVLLVVVALVLGVMVLGAGAAFAGEVTGSGKGGPNGDGVPGAVGRGNSACLFSGLEDFDGENPVEPGTVQNWGHAKDAPVVVSAPRGASDVILDFDGPGGEAPFSDGCNARLHPQK